jgi:hypothetical protein
MKSVEKKGMPNIPEPTLEKETEECHEVCIALKPALMRLRLESLASKGAPQ